MKAAPQELLKEYMKTQKFTSTAEIMAAMKEMFRDVDGMEEKILALYACGMSQQDIAEQIKELYDVEISPELVTKITEKMMPKVTAWQNRPLEAVYPQSRLQHCTVHQIRSSTRFVSWKDIKQVVVDPFP